MKQKPQNEPAKRRIYTPPRLRAYGDVRSLTQSGSRNGKESVQQPNKGANKP